LQITDIITDPQDSDRVWYYVRTTREDNKEVKRYYPDIFASDERLEYNPEPGKTIKKWIPRKERDGANTDIVYEEKARVYHVAFNTIDQRGIPLLAAAMDWATAMSRFLDSRLAIQRSLAQFPWKEKIKGGAAAVNARVAALQSSYQAGVTSETNPPAASGSTFVGNAGVDREPIPQNTGGSDAQKDALAIIQMFCSATGCFPHYYGFGEPIRLATAQAMEAPMMKEFRSYQMLWTDTWSTLFEIVMNQAKIPPHQRSVDIDYEPVLDAARAEIFEGIKTLHSVYGWIGASPEVAMRGIVALGINDADKVVERGFVSQPASETDGGNSSDEQVKAKDAGGQQAFEDVPEAEFASHIHDLTQRLQNAT